MSVFDFQETLTQAVRTVTATGSLSQNVVAITFATQANSFALVDAHDNPLTPFILWSDQRANGLAAPIYEFADNDDYRFRTGVATINHLFMPLKIRWLQQNEPNAIASTERLVLLSDYFSWWLTGEWCSEASTAALSGLVDIHRLEWWPAACSAAGIATTSLNRLVRTGSVLRTVRPDVASNLGLPLNCVLIAGCLDQHAGAIGSGNVVPGGVSETTGTVLATVRCSSKVDRLQLDNIFQGPSFEEGIFYQMLFSEQSAGLLERYRREKAPALGFSDLDALASQSPRGARGLRLRANAFDLPTNEMFENRTAEHNQTDEVRAILEGVALQLRRQVETLCGDVRPDTIRSSGGGAKSDLWRSIKQQTLGIPVTTGRCPEPVACGAALIAISRLKNKPLVELGPVFTTV